MFGLFGARGETEALRDELVKYEAWSIEQHARVLKALEKQLEYTRALEARVEVLEELLGCGRRADA